MVQRLDCRIIKFLCRHCAAFSFCREVVKLAATRLIALHKNKGKSVAACLKSRTDYAQNPDKTQQGELVSSYECSPLTVDEEFMLSKRQYELVTGRRQKSDVIAYQIRQSFKPGEITAEEANKVGYQKKSLSAHSRLFSSFHNSFLPRKSRIRATSSVSPSDSAISLLV